MDEYIGQNQDLFKEAMTFGKGQFTKGEAWVDRLTNYGMDASGKLNANADRFESTVNKRIKDLEATGDKFGKANENLFKTGTDMANRLNDTLVPGMEKEGELSGSLLDRYEKQGIPFQDQYLAKLKGWDSATRREGRAGEAVNDIALTTEAARESELRRLESYGIDPSQTRSAALDSRIQAQTAVAKAAAANQARRGVEQEGMAYGKQASDMYQQSLKDAGALSESSRLTGATAAAIQQAPGAQYLQGLGNLANYGQGVAQLEQAGGNTAFNMRQNASNFGMTALGAGATQQNAMNQYGSGIYDQAGRFTSQSGNLLNSGYQTGGQLNRNDLAAHEMDQQNSFMGGLGSLVGMALPAALGSPWLGGAVSGMLGGFGGVGAAGSNNSGVLSPYIPNNGTQVQFRAAGGEIPKEASPSKGALPDDVPAFLNAGEFVMDDQTVRWHGVKNLRKLQEQAQKGMSGIPA